MLLGGGLLLWWRGLMRLSRSGLLLSACDGLLRTGAAKKDIEIVRVPGAFEIPSGGADFGFDWEV